MMTVAARLRAAAYISGGYPPGIFFTRQHLLELAGELEPGVYGGWGADSRAILTPGHEAIGYVGEYRSNFFFEPTSFVDLRTWKRAYRIGYYEPHYGVPVLRPRIRVKMWCHRGESNPQSYAV
jgi:hypothetical protein